MPLHGRLLMAALLLLAAPACLPGQEVTVDRDQLLRDTEFLSADSLQGRLTGTPGNRMAQQFIEERFESLGLNRIGQSYRHPFTAIMRQSGEQAEAVNLIGYVEGTRYPDRFLVVTAHYDHLGARDGEIYNGADDNASGTSALMAAAALFTEHPPENSILFIAFDAEEQGLLGARHFTEHPVVPLGQIVLNVNMDMISVSAENELYAVGTWHYEFLKPMVEEATREAPVNVLFGFDHPDAPQDWTFASDHGPFHQQGIPFLYFGVEDHENYHQPGDTFENIHPDFFYGAVTTILGVIRELDRRLDEVI